MRSFEKFLIPAGGVAILALVIFSIFFFILPQNTAQAPVVPVGDFWVPVEESLRNIIVAEPVAGGVIGFPLTIVGQARVFEAVFHYRVTDDARVVLAEGHAMADAPDTGEFGSFTVLVNYDEPTVPGGVVEVFSYSAKDGSEQDMVRIPVVFSVDASAEEVLVYFVPRNASENGGDCTDVTEVTRRVPDTVAIAHAALGELLEGVDASEGEEFVSLIPTQAKVRSIGIEDGVATVTFVQDSFLGSAGSCMVTGIRAQIEATLKQFSSVTSVIILEEGKSADKILQP
ncbi:MAG: Gmad2 immunoglobulin-like domain-containing protein [Patescibacteria group bacterium]